MVHPFVRKLRHGANLDPEDERLLISLAQSVRSIGAREDILTDGAQVRSLPLIVEGWACRYKLLTNGKRQITALLVPGDLCEPFGVMRRCVTYSIGALTPIVLAPVSLDAIRGVARDNPRIEAALWWDMLTGSAIEREHVVSLGRRSASERTGHLFCELHLRLAMVGLADDAGYTLPVTQADLGDLLGLSAVHVNRSLQELRRTGLISLRERRLTIRNLAELREFSLFDTAYLYASGPA